MDCPSVHRKLSWFQVSRNMRLEALYNCSDGGAIIWVVPSVSPPPPPAVCTLFFFVPFKMIWCSKLHNEELVLCTYLIFIVKDVQGVRTCSSHERIKDVHIAICFEDAGIFSVGRQRILLSPMYLRKTVSKYSKTCLKRNLNCQEHFFAEARFPFNQGLLW
jgi:hypothetical protein